jgi:hypothetical protein
MQLMSVASISMCWLRINMINTGSTCHAGMQGVCRQFHSRIPQTAEALAIPEASYSVLITSSEEDPVKIASKVFLEKPTVPFFNKEQRQKRCKKPPGKKQGKAQANRVTGAKWLCSSGIETALIWSPHF